MRWIDREEVAERLTYEACLPIVREAMIAFSKGETVQLLRSIVQLGEGRMFGVMPGGMGSGKCFGAKLISVFPENFAKGVQSHQGVVVLAFALPLMTWNRHEWGTRRMGAYDGVAWRR